jgi:hypothetical protein
MAPRRFTGTTSSRVVKSSAAGNYKRSLGGFSADCALPQPQYVAVIEGIHLTQAQKDYLAAAKDGVAWRARIAELRSEFQTTKGEG